MINYFPAKVAIQSTRVNTYLFEISLSIIIQAIKMAVVCALKYKQAAAFS